MNTIVLIIVLSIVVMAILIYAYKSYTYNAQNSASSKSSMSNPTPSLPLLPSPSFPSVSPSSSPTPTPRMIEPTTIPTTPAPTLPTILSTKKDISTFAKDDLTGYWLLHIGDNFNNLTDNQDVVVLYQKFKNPNDINDQNAWPNYWKVTQQMNGTPEKQFPALKEDSTNSSVMISYPNGSNKLLLWSGDANDGYTYLSIGSDAVFLKRVYLENGKWKPYFVPKTTPAPITGDFSKKDISSFKKDDLSGYWLLHVVDNVHNFRDNQDIILQYKKSPNPLSLADAQTWPNYWEPIKQITGNPEKLPSMKATENGHMAMHFFSDEADMMMYWGGNTDEYTYLNGGFDGAQYNIVLKRVYFDKDMDKWISYFSPVITPVPTKAFSSEKQATPFSATDLTGYWMLHIADNSHNLKNNQDAIFLYQKMNNPLGQVDKQFWPNYWGPVKQMSGEQENLDMVPSLKQNSGGSATAIHFFNNAGDSMLSWGDGTNTYLNFGPYGGDIVNLRRVYFENGVWKNY